MYQIENVIRNEDLGVLSETMNMPGEYPQNYF